MEPTVNELGLPPSRLGYSAGTVTHTLGAKPRLELAVLHALLAQLPVGVVVASGKGRIVITYENDAARRILPRDFASVDRTTPDGARYQKVEWAMARALLLGEVVRDEEIDFVLPDGTHRWLSVSATPIRTDPDRIDGAVVTFADVTAVKQAAAWQPIIESLYRL